MLLQRFSTWLHAEADGSDSINRHGDRSASALAQRVHRKPLRLVRQDGPTHDVLNRRLDVFSGRDTASGTAVEAAGEIRPFSEGN